MKKFAVCAWMQIAVICKIKTNISEIRKAFPPFFQLNFRHCICVAIFIILESHSEKLWDQNYKLRPQNYKLRPQNYKLRSQNYKLRPQNYKLRSQNYKLRSQNYKLRPQNYKLRSQNYKLRPQNYKLRVQNLQVWQLKLISYNFLKRCFECTVNGSLQMVVTVACKLLYWDRLYKVHNKYFFFAHWK